MIKQANKVRYIQNGKEKKHLSLKVTVWYVWTGDIKILETGSEFTKVVSYKIRLSKSAPFYLNHKQLTT